MKKNLIIINVIAISLVIINWSCVNTTNETSMTADAETEIVHSINYNEDLGGKPWVLDVENATLANDNYRVANWTGQYMQLVFMTLKPGEVIDLEMHDGHDQFIRIEQGEARVLMGETEDNLSFDEMVSDDWAILIPAGYWHKIENVGSTDLKVYTLYGPAEHQMGTIHKTHAEAEEAHDHEH